MAGPISTNAPFNEFGHSMLLRDIEMLYLLVGQRDGDLGQQGYGATSVGQYGSGGDVNAGRVPSFAGRGPSSGGGTVHYLGTLDLPIFGGSSTVAGNAAGQFAVDWQQSRNGATQVASGIGATIAGGRRNTASGDYSLAAGDTATASGANSFAFNGTASATGAIALGSTVASSAGLGLFGTTGSAPSGTAIRATLSFSAVTTATNNTAIGAGETVNLTGTSATNVVIGPFNSDSFAVKNTVTRCTVIGSRRGNAVGNSGGMTASDSVLIDAVGNPLFGGRAAYSCYFVSGANTIGSSTDIFFGCSAGSSSLSITRNFFGSDAWVSGGSAAPSPSTYATYIGNSSLTGGTFLAGYTYSLSMDLANAIVFANGATSLFSITSIGDTTIKGAFGCNAKTPQTAFASGGAVSAGPPGVTYTATEQSMLAQLKQLTNNIRTALVNNGIMS